MLCVTSSNVYVDRVACPWLTPRFIDDLAEFQIVPAGEIIEAQFKVYGAFYACCRLHAAKGF